MGKIYEFNPQIYKTRLWVAKRGVTKDEIDKVFYALNEDEEGVSFADNHEMPDYGTALETYIVGHKESKIKGCLVVINREVTVGSLAHEASHCADWLFEDIGEATRSYEHGEPQAYYIEWVTDRLYEVYKGKVK